MPLFDDFQSGDRLTAEWVQLVTREILKLMKIGGAGGIRVSKSNTGFNIAYTGETILVRIAHYQAAEGDDYPEPNDDCFIFPAILETGSFDEETEDCETEANFTGSKEIKVYNLAEKYIEADHRGLIFKIGKNWFAYDGITIARFIEFELTSDMDEGDPSGNATVENYWDGYEPPGETIGVLNLMHFKSDAGKTGVAVWSEAHGAYVIFNVECSDRV